MNRESLKTIRLYAIILLAVFSIGCSQYIVETTHSFENSNWKIADTAIFQFTPEQLGLPHDIFIKIDHSNDYKYGNIYLFTDIVFPDKTVIKDTIQYILIDNNYDWIGSGSGTKTITFPFRRSATFPQAGNYTFKFTQAMRDADSTLRGIESISLLIK